MKLPLDLSFLFYPAKKAECKLTGFDLSGLVVCSPSCWTHACVQLLGLKIRSLLYWEQWNCEDISWESLGAYRSRLGQKQEAKVTYSLKFSVYQGLTTTDTPEFTETNPHKKSAMDKTREWVYQNNFPGLVKFLHSWHLISSAVNGSEGSCDNQALAEKHWQWYILYSI